jgi:hypothetical protein
MERQVSKPGPPPLAKIVSGGQTGVDRAGLDAGLDSGLAVGGWCPKGRLAEDGAIPARYALREMAKPGYPPRTRQNVLDSDATLILSDAEPTGGTRLTMVFALKLSKPFLVAAPDTADPAMLAAWLRDNRVGVLNVAGPKESKCPGIYRRCRELLRQVFSLLARPDRVGEPPAGYLPRLGVPGRLKQLRASPIRKPWPRRKPPKTSPMRRAILSDPS